MVDYGVERGAKVVIGVRTMVHALMKPNPRAQVVRRRVFNFTQALVLLDVMRLRDDARDSARDDAEA